MFSVPKKFALKTGLAFLLALASTQSAAQSLNGTVQWSGKWELGLAQDGIVDQVHVKTGDTVTEGQLLLELDARPFEARIAKTKAILDRQKLDFEEATREYERQQELYNRRSIPRRTLYLAEIDLAGSKARYEEAKADLEITMLELEQSRLTAPFDGKVIEIQTVSGQAISNRFQTRTLLVLARNKPLEVHAHTQEANLGRWLKGQHYRAEHKSLGQVNLVLTAIADEATVSDLGKRYKLIFELDVANKEIRHGDIISIQIPAG